MCVLSGEIRSVQFCSQRSKPDTIRPKDGQEAHHRRLQNLNARDADICFAFRDLCSAKDFNAPNNVAFRHHSDTIEGSYPLIDTVAGGRQSRSPRDILAGSNLSVAVAFGHRTRECRHAFERRVGAAPPIRRCRLVRRNRKRAAEVPAPLPPVTVVASFFPLRRDVDAVIKPSARVSAPNPPQDSGGASAPPLSPSLPSAIS